MATADEHASATIRWWFDADDPAGLLAQLDERAPGGVVGDRPVSQISGSGQPGSGRVEGRARLGIVDPTDRKVRLARRLVAKGEPWRGRSDIWFTPAGLAGPDTKIAFLYPGVEPAAGTHTIDLPELGRALGLEAPEVSYDTVAHQGASIFQLGIFLDAALRAVGVVPDVAAGHSVGEWAGSVTCGYLPGDRADGFLSGLDLHGLALPELDFAAITAGATRIGLIIKSLDDVVISHDNCPGQSVICGPPASVDQALALLRDDKVLGQKLPFQSGFHTPAIAPALGTIRQMIGGLPFQKGKVPMWSATLAAPYPDNPDEIRELHLRHLVEPVRFREMIEHLFHDGGARIFVQLGTGSLAAFVEDTLAGANHVAIEGLVAKRSALAQMHRALTALWVEGLDVHPERLTSGSATNPSGAASWPLRQAESTMSDQSSQSDQPIPPAEPAAVPAAVPGPVPFSLLAATDLLANAAAAGQQVLDALATRYDLAPMTARTATRDAVEAARAATVAPPAPIRPAAAPTPPPAPAPAPAAAPAPAPAPAAQPTPAQPAPVTPIATPSPAAGATGTGRPWPTGKIVITERLSLETRPETIDHTLYEQRPGWHDPSDMFPIMAMTTQIDLLQKLAAEFGGGRDIVEVFGVRNFRWLDLSDPIDVEITVTPKGDDVLALALGAYCRLNVRFGAFAPGPAHEPIPLTGSRPTTYTADEMFEKKIMFHGPLYQGVDSMGPTGDEGMVGTFEHLETPGSLLDNFGKLVAYWVIDKRGYIGEGALPTGLGKIVFHGPEPTPGTKVHADIRIVELQANLVRSDGFLVLPDGRIWCRVENWTSFVFHLDELMERVAHGPADNHCTEPQPDGWNLVRERWPGGSSRDMTSRRYLNRPEREIYDNMPLVDQRRWLLDIIAIKDSARLWLKYIVDLPTYPAEITVIPDGPNHWLVEGPWRDEYPKLNLRVTTSAEVDWLTAAMVSHTDQYFDIEARAVPAGADPEEIRRQLHDDVAARNPGRRISSVAKPEFFVSSFVAEAIHPAVAWTARPDDEISDAARWGWTPRSRRGASDEPAS